MKSLPAGTILLILLMAGGAVGVTPVRAAIDVFAASGDPSPTGNGALALFNAPTLNSNGQAAFVAQLTGTSGGSADNLALYRQGTGGLTQIVRTGSTKVNGLTMTGFFPASSWIDAGGAVTAVVSAGPAPGQIHNVIGDGEPVPLQFQPNSPHPEGNGTLLGVQTSTQNDAGDAVFTASTVSIDRFRRSFTLGIRQKSRMI